MFHRPAYARIIADHLEENFLVLRSMVQEDQFFCPVVKANAYGHGVVGVAQKLVALGAKHLGVSLTEEAIELREAGISTPIVQFGPISKYDVETINQNKIIPLISSQDSLRALDENSDRSSIQELHLKFDTGMNRLGFSVEEARSLASFMVQARHLKLTGVCTHLSRGNDVSSVEMQTNSFLEVGNYFDLRKYQSHIYNTDGLFSATKSNKAVFGARPGLGLYGYSYAQTPMAKKLKPVMSLHAKIVNIRSLKSGSRVSYDGTWVAKRDSIIGVIPLGYADGIPRHLSNKGRVLMRGQLVPVVGRVCMDYFMVDLTDLAQLNPQNGDEVEVFGTNRNLADLAEEAGTFAYEILTKIGQRVPRIVV